MRRHTISGTALGAALLATAARAADGEPGSAPALAFEEIPLRAGAGSAFPNLAVSNDGRAYVCWLEPRSSETHVLVFAALEGERWGTPRRIAQGSRWFVNWADFPSLVAAEDGSLAAHWLARHPDATTPYGYDVRITSSRDGGATWRTAQSPHTDGTPTEHGFASLLPAPGGAVRAFWLDGRETGRDHGAASGGGGHGRGSLTLRTALVASDGALSEEALLDPRVCDCCQTAAARTASGAVVVYRDRSPEEVRDVSVVRLDADGWSRPRPVHEDGWVMPGCPVDGPAVAADEDDVVVVWFTRADDEARVQAAFSTDGGATFGEPVIVDDGSALGRADVAWLPGGDALVSWVEVVEGGAELRARRVASDGSLRGDSLALTRIWATRASGFPRIARHGDSVLVAWTDASKPSRVRTGRVTL